MVGLNGTDGQGGKALFLANGTYDVADGQWQGFLTSISSAAPFPNGFPELDWPPYKRAPLNSTEPNEVGLQVQHIRRPGDQV